MLDSEQKNWPCCNLKDVPSLIFLHTVNVQCTLCILYAKLQAPHLRDHK